MAGSLLLVARCNPGHSRFVVRDWRTKKKQSATKKRTIDYSDIPPLSDRQLASLRRVGRPPTTRLL